MFPKVLYITMCACSDVLETNVNKCFHLAHWLHVTRQHLFTRVCTLHATCSHLFPFVCPSIFLICAICGTLCAWIVPARQVMQIAYHKILKNNQNNSIIFNYFQLFSIKVLCYSEFMR